MGTVIFKVDDRLKAIVDHTKEHGECVGFENEPISHSLAFVKDHGAYLGSASSVPLPDPDGDGTRRLVTYAEGMNPDADEDFWDEARLQCGGDDFVEYIDIEVFERAIKSGKKKVTMRLTEDSPLIEYA